MWFWTEDFWRVVEDMGWGKTYDTVECAKRLLQHVEAKDDIQRLREISKQKQGTLDDLISYYQGEKKLTRFWGGSDDSYWDFRAHCVGLGKKYFVELCNDITKIDKVGNGYVECFDYCFTRAEELFDTEEGQKLVRIGISRRSRPEKLMRVLGIETGRDHLKVEEV